MKHNWVRVYSRVNPVHRCRNCGMRKRTERGLGRRGGSRVAFRRPKSTVYRLLLSTPPCPPDPVATLRDVDRVVRQIVTAEVLANQVMYPSEFLRALKGRL
jgi:hypothetical protein